MKRPVFIVGCGRSGTAFLYHTLVSAGGFAEFRTQMNVFDVLGPMYGDLSDLNTKQKMMRMWLGSMAFRRSGLDATQIKNRIISECRSAADFERIVFEEIARSQNVDRWADSTPTSIYHLREIKKGIPDALFVHIIRDGRNVALSLDARGWSHPLFWEKDMGVMAAGLYWKWTILRGRQEAAEVNGDYMEILYEDLLTKPQESLATLSAFLRHDLDFNTIQRSAMGALKNPPTSFKAELEKGQFDPLNRWKKILSPEQLALFESLVGDLLQKLGYTLATPREKLQRSFKVKRMQTVYPMLFDLKRWTRKHPLITRFLVDYDAILIEK